MVNLQIIPEREVSLQVLEPVIKTGAPVIRPKRITENGSYSAKAEGASGFDPVEVAVDLTPAFEAGKKAEYDRFWDAFQDRGKRVSYGNAFLGTYWNNENLHPKYDMMPSNYGVSGMFENCGYVGDLVELCEKQGITIDFSEGFEFSKVFYGTKFTRIGVIDARKATRFYYVFCYSSNLKTIDKIIAAETTPFSQSFQGLGALEEIRFEGTIGVSLQIQNSPLLSEASVRSILAHLKDLTGASAQTLTFHSEVGAKLTEAQKAEITAKNWILVY